MKNVGFVARCTWAIVAGTILLNPAIAQDQTLPASRADFRYERPAAPGAKGANRIEIDVPLLVGSDPLEYVGYRDADGKEWQVFVGGLADLRFFDKADREIPYLLVPPPSPAARWISGTILPITPKKDKSSGFEVDLSVLRLADHLRLIGIPAPFLKKFHLEGSGDRSRWTVLEDEGTIFDLPDENLKRTVISFMAGEYRYFRFTWDDRTSARVPVPRIAEARSPGAVLPAPPLRIDVPFKRIVSEPGKSRFVIQLPGPHFPIQAIELLVRGGPLLRQAMITEATLSGEEVASLPLGTATIRRAGHGDLVAADLRIPITAPKEPEFELVVDDGDNPPLDLSGVRAELAPLPWIFFESENGEPIMARFGAGHMPPPQYDLEAERNLLPETKCSDAQWGEVNDLIPLSATLPQTSPLPLIGAPIDGKQFRYSRRIMAGDPGLSAVTLDAAVLAHSDLDDLRIADSSGRQVPYLLEKRDEPLVLKLKIHKRISGRKDRTSNYLSTYKVDLQFDSLPSCRLVLSTVARVFDRMVTINAERTSEDRRAESRVETLASARWRHLAEDRADPLLVLDLAELLTSQLTISIDEGDNSPLPIKSIQLLFPSYRLRFFHGAGASLTLYYGAPSLSRPRYDLALLAPRLTGAAAHELSLSPETILSPATSAAPLQKRLFWGMLIVATVVLLFLLVRLLLSGVKPPEQPQSR